MTALVGPFLTAAVASLLATPLARRLAWHWRAVDEADGARKRQTAPIPYLGGAALLVALACGTLAAWQIGTADPLQFLTRPLTAALLFSAAIICAVGWVDDRFHLRVRWKLLGQVLATLPLVFGGHVLSRVEFCGIVVELGWWAIPLTIGWLVAGANAWNFIDGADGLAAALGLVVAAATTLVADQLGQTEAAALAAVLAGALAGFLLYNWQPATIYLGDCGSMAVGLWLAATVACGSRTTGLGSRLVVLAALFALPLADLALAVVRRQLSGLPFWIADRAHIHHRLLDRGYTAPQVAGLLAGVSAVCGAIALAAAVHGRELLAWSSLAMLVLVVQRFGLAGTHEWELARGFAARRLLDLLALVSPMKAPGHLPRASQLERLPIGATWTSFLAAMDQVHVHAIEVALTPGQGPTVFRWSSPAYACVDGEGCSLEVEARGAAGKSCRLRASVRQQTATDTLPWLMLAQTLRTYAAHWADHADALAAALAGTPSSHNLTTLPPVGDHRACAA